MDEVTKNLQVEVPRCLLFADDIVLVRGSLEEVNGRLENRKKYLEVKYCRSKTEYIEFDFGERVHGANRKRQLMKMNGNVVVKWFKYLGVLL